MNKKGESGINAAVLVAIIAGLIILYIIFLPSSDREKLLNGENTANPEESENVLLSVSPGILKLATSLENEKIIPNVFLVESTEAQVLETINPFIVRNGVFDKSPKSTEFILEDPENTDNVVLALSTKKRQGILTIKLNGNTIFENELSSDVTQPISLSKSQLQKKNTLEFSVSSVGMAFWRTNEYSLENVKIIGDITDTSRQESTNIFTISDSEFSSLETSTLKFVPYCANVNQVGMLEVFVNNRKLFSSVPVCNNIYRQPLPKSFLSEGENNLVFKTGKGSYNIEQIGITLQMKTTRARTYYFEVTAENFEKIRNGDKKAELSMKFADSGQRRRAKLDINGHLETIDTDKVTLVKDIASKISEGNNFVRIEPYDELEVADLRIELK